MKYIVLIIALSLSNQGCAAYLLAKMAGHCRGSGVKSSEIDDGYIKVVCKDGTVERYRQ